MGKFKALILGAFLGIAGLVILGVSTSWWASLGVFLMLFGSNLEQSSGFDGDES